MLKQLTTSATLIIVIYYTFPTLLFAQTPNRKFIDPANMDLSYRPGDDFYLYASGNWIKNNPVPPKETRWGSFMELREFNIQAVKKILENAANDNTAAPGSVKRRVGDFYAAGMDSLTIEKRGTKPVAPYLQRIDAIKDKNALAKEMNELRKIGLSSAFFSFYIAQDRKNVEMMMPHLGQGGTSLPDRDYYLKSDARSVEIQNAYKQYIARLFTLTGKKSQDAQEAANIIFNLEKQLAAAQMSRVEMRDPYKTYHKMAIKSLNQAAPGFDWQGSLAQLGVSGVDSIIVSHPGFLKEVGNIYTQAPQAHLKFYLQWNILRNSATLLNQQFFEASFAFNQVLTGQKVPTPRWQRISQLTDASIGDLLGQLYVAEHFKPEAKQRMDELVENLRKAFALRIRNLEWMSDATKEKALAKLAAFRPKVGYPAKWKNYEGLVIDRSKFYENNINVSRWNFNYMMSQLGKPVDRERWGMTPPTVNAYYNPTLNEIVFPAGILQFPFFHPDADDAVNYGGIGAVIGHEMSHGFDDSGSQYDADGNLRNWWTDDDRKRFQQRAEMLVKQFDAYTVLDTLHVNGKLTLGENIGDLGGVNVAYEAFKMTRQGQSNEIIDGFTPDQRFFLSWAQVWRGNVLPQTAAQLIITDTHSPGQYRTIGPLVNIDAWYKAFNIQPGDKLYKAPEQRIKIW